MRSASFTNGLNNATRVKIWGSKPYVWALEIIKADGKFYVYFAADGLNNQRMYYISSNSATSGYSSAVFMNLPDNKWAIDGVPFK